MDIHPELKEPLTPKLSFEHVHYRRSEDSGYTSYKRESLEYSDISNSSLFTRKIRFTDHLQLDYCGISKEITYEPTCKENNGHIRSDDFKQSTQSRRGIKRVFEEDPDDMNINETIKTPTSTISSAMRKLKFRSIENNKINSYNSIKLARDLYTNENIPTTPIKKDCNNGHKPCSPLDIKKRLNLEMHSIYCDKNALQPSPKCSEESFKKYNFKPTQKIDIMSLLYNSNIVPPIIKILDYLLPQDIINFKSVSSSWRKIWNFISIRQMKLEYLNFVVKVRENQENKPFAPVNINTSNKRALMETNNLSNVYQIRSDQNNSSNSPPGTPRTIKFRKFAKAALLDSRKQLSCVRCCQPAKVTEESSGEEWVECTSQTCSYQFCKFCKCDRHPNKNCFKYDLDGPSPSKRKENSYAVGSKKSRRNLKRLL